MSGQAHPTPLLRADHFLCPRCGHAVLLLAPTVAGRVCTWCYVDLGQPRPVNTRKPHEVVAETWQRMQKRKGADAAAVRRGV